MTVGQRISKLAVIHWFPLEQFPPVQNLLDAVSRDSRFECHCFTTTNDRGLKEFSAGSVVIQRRPFPSRQHGRLRRIWRLLSFPMWVCWQLFWFRPDALLYFEPHSSAAAFLYLLCNRQCRLLIHYHEYREPREYQDRGNRLFGWYHQLERRFLYERAVWISHTNSDRVRLFLQDTPEVSSAKVKVLPNYPPVSWQGWSRPVREAEAVVKLVYVGAASIRDTFIREVVQWVQGQRDGSVSLALYINNSDSETDQLLRQAAAECGRVLLYPGGVPYEQLPQLLCQYDVGLILYRGNTPNYVFNAPNKLFEYLTCGLDVWYPGCMLGVKPYARSDARPQVLETDFQQLSALDLSVRMGGNLPCKPWLSASEQALQPLLQAATEQAANLRPGPL